jgi:YbbR domain-containing protein
MRALLRSLFNLFFNNFGYKLLAILLAVVVWAIIQGEQIQEVNREILVEIHVSPEYGVRGDLLRIKAATIRGPQAWLLEVPKRLTAEVVVPPGKVGEHRVRLSKDDVKNLNERLELIIHEPNLVLYVDKLMERSVPIKETLHGAPAEGYTVEKVSIEPKNVIVKGIRKDVMDLRTIYTEPMDVTNLQQSKSQDARLISPGLGSEALSQETVKVTLQVGNSRINKRFSNIPVEVVGAQRRTKITPQVVSILVQGVPNVLNNLQRNDFKAFIEVRSLGPGRYEEEIKVKIPADTVLIETFPEKGNVTILGD